MYHWRSSLRQLTLDSAGDELIPEDGKDEAYDKIVEEITALEEELDDELKKFQPKVK